MRSLVIVLACALLAAPAYGVGNTATVRLTTDGAVLNGGQMEIDESAISSPFFLDIYIENATDANLTAFQVTLSGPSTHSISAASTFFGNTLNYAGAYSSYAARGGGFADLGWDMSAVGSIVFPGEPLPQAAAPANQVGTIPNGLTASPGWVAWAEINSDPVVGDVFGIVVAAVGDSDFSPMELEIIPLVITPEPASALLLLAGLPLLRRRR